ncbi:uncharacterized protein LOC123899731 [Trifolium pratense]|uniref:uncharacterized protein LOC123899731 n=1 Tax=Trifolium pratense TaxID=57577 RepID=UPI001E695810|nr:uncharacterized protein LOC123899731 [Trifolium pratense]
MATTYVQDDTVDPSFKNIQGLNLDDKRTQAILLRTKGFAKNYPRMDKTEMFTAYECSSISIYLNGTKPGFNTTKHEVDHILSVSYQIFRDYCALMCHGLQGVTENLTFNCKTGEVCPLMKKHKKTARTFYAVHRSTIQNFDLLRSIFLYTWDQYFGEEGVCPCVEVGGDLLAIANDPPVNTSTSGDGLLNPYSDVGDVPRVIADDPPMNTSTFGDGLNPYSDVGDVQRVIANDPPVNNSVLQQTNKRTHDDTEKDSSSDSEVRILKLYVASTPPDTEHNVG